MFFFKRMSEVGADNTPAEEATTLRDPDPERFENVTAPLVESVVIFERAIPDNPVVAHVVHPTVFAHARLQ